MLLHQYVDQVRNYLQRRRSSQRIKGQKTGRLSRIELEVLEDRVVPAGSWQNLAASGSGPTNGLSMMLLSDGTAAVQGGSGSPTATWYQLTPTSGSYVTGSWSSLGSMNQTRRFFPTSMLPNGTIFAAGGEYSNPTSPGTVTDNNTAEIFNPLANNGNGSWTYQDSFPQAQFGDEPTEVLPGGSVLTGGGAYAGGFGAGFAGGAQTWFFNSSQPAGQQWSAAANKITRFNSSGSAYYDSSDEESWVKLPDGSILTYDIWASAALGKFYAERYIPAGTPASRTLGVSNVWKDASPAPGSSNPPSILSTGNQGLELGPAFLLPDGRVFYFGANGNTAYYTPATNTWTAGPAEPAKPLTISANPSNAGADYIVTPGGPPTFLVATDDPGAMLPNGNILIALSPLGPLNAAGGYSFPDATYIYEFNPTVNPSTTNPWTEVTPIGGIGFNAYQVNMLLLPSGQVLLDNEQGGFQIYTPGNGPKSAWQPTISGISGNGNGTATLTGTQLNGISEGATYGDDMESASNYPIIQLTGSDGIVRYARTYNWSSTGVATLNLPESVQFTMPAGATDVNQLSVIANGIASNPVVFVSGDSNVLTNSITLDTTALLGVPTVTVNVNGAASIWPESNLPLPFATIFHNAGVAVAPGVWSIGNTITVRSTLAGLPTAINGGSLGTIILGHDGTLQDIKGRVAMESTPAFSNITIDDSADQGLTATLGTVNFGNDLDGDNDLFGQISGLAPAVLDYEYQDTNSITISTGSADTMDVLATGTTTNLIGSGATGVETTTVNVGHNGSVQGIVGTLNIDNPSAENAIIVDDSADISQRTVTLGTFTPANGGAWGYISALAPAHINYAYSDTSSLSVLTGPAPNTIAVLATGVLTNLVDSGGSNTTQNTTTVGSGGSVLGIVGTLNIENPPAGNAITVDDSGVAGQTATLTTLGANPADSEQNTETWGSVGGLSLGLINYEYADTNSLTLLSGPAATVNVSGIGTTTNVIGFGVTSDDNTTINVGAGGSLRGIRGTLNLDNPSNYNLITVDDSADQNARTVTLGTFTPTVGTIAPTPDTDWGSIRGIAPSGIQINYEYADTASLTVKGGSGNNTYNVQATGATTTLDTGSGNDVVNLGKAHLLLGIQALLTVVGQGGTDTLNANDRANTAAQTYSLNATVLYVRPFSLGITYSGMSNLVLGGSQGGSSYNIVSTAASTSYRVNGGSGNDTFNVSSFFQNLDTIAGALRVFGGGGTDTLDVDDQNNTAPETYTLTGNALFIGRFLLGINYTDIRMVVLNGSQGVSTNNIYSTIGGTAYTINGGTGGATFNVGNPSNSLAGIQGALTVNGQGGVETLNVNDQGAAFPMTYMLTPMTLTRTGAAKITYSGLSSMELNGGGGGNVFTVTGTMAGTATTLNAGAGADTVKMAANAAAYSGPLTINGQAGVNTLNYSGFTGPVTVDLPLDIATAVAGGISNILNLTGGSGDDLFVGNGQGNKLTGGTGRNMLVAGASPGTLMGGTANKGTLMVGGTTNYDTNLVALDAIMAEWTAKAPYATRVNALLNGGGQNGSYLLGPTDFTNNGGGNTLLGGVPGLDLYYGIEALDTNDWMPSLGEVFIQNPSQVSFQINAQALSEPLLFLDGGTPVYTQTPGTFDVAPGVHTLSDPYAPGASVSFTVLADGNVTYQTSLAGILGGQMTNTLIVSGAAITFDAQALSYTALRFDTILSDLTAAPFTLNLLPGTNSFQELYLSGSQINFNVGDNGEVSYAPALEGVLSGQGTSTLVINGVTITVNAQALTNSYYELRIDTNLTDSPAVPFTLTLLPGPHTLADLFGQGSVQFSLADDGTISYAASLETVLSGQGTTSLVVYGAAVIIDAQALSDPELLFNNYTEQESTTPFTVYLLPGTGTLQELGEPSTSVTFSVAANDTLSYDPSLDGILSGQGTNTLVVNGTTITVDAHALSDPLLQVDVYIQETTAKPFSLTVLPGTQTFQEYGESNTAVNFTVAADGTVSYDPSLDAILSGEGTSTLVVNGVTITVNAQALSDPYLQIDNYIEQTTSAPFALTVLPGTQTLQELLQSGTALNFTVATDGTVSYDPSLAGILSGSGTPTLVVNGVTITVNAQALSDPYVQVDTYILSLSTTTPFTLTVLPGTHTLQEYLQGGTGLNFIVAADGDVSYDPSLNGILSGQGNTLVVNGETLIVNATAISATVSSFSIGAFTNLSTAQVQTLQVLPGTTTFSDSTLQFILTLSTTDQLSFPADVDTQVSGSGTNTLVILS